MTREEFINDVTLWHELIDIAQEYDFYEVVEDIVDTGYIVEEIRSEARNIGGGDDWERFASWVSEIPQGYEYYLDNGDDGFNGLDERDFEEYKADLLNRMDEDDCFDEEAEEEGDELENLVEEEPDEEAPQEDFSAIDLINMCAAEASTIKKVPA